MSNQLEHIIAGAIGACLVNGYDAKLNGRQMTSDEVVRSAVTGAIFSVIPDVIEPPNDPNHRGTAHSTAALSLLFAQGKDTLSKQDISAEQKTIILSALAGYSSHLLLDAFSPKGLPPV